MRRGLRAKFLIAFLMVLAMPTLNTGLALWESVRVRSSASSLASDAFPRLESVSLIGARLHDMAEAFEQATIYEDRQRLDAALQLAREIEQEFQKFPSDPVLTTLAEDVQHFAETSALMANAVLAGEELDKALGAEDDSASAGEALETQIKEYRLAVADHFQIALLRMKATSERTLVLTSLAQALTLLVAVSIAFVLTRKLTERIQRVGTRLHEIAQGEGDLSARIEESGNDEISELARWFNLFSEKLHVLISDVASVVRGGTESLATASQQISGSAMEQTTVADRVGRSLEQIATSAKVLQRRAHDLSSALETTTSDVRVRDALTERLLDYADSLAIQAEGTAASIHQLIASIGSIGDNLDGLRSVTHAVDYSLKELDGAAGGAQDLADATHSLAEASLAAASKGSESVEEATSGMSQIQESFSQIEDVVSDLATNSDEMDEVVGVIAEISERTRLLALNAQIIAAQAGEHGRSFAVVAHQVNELATRSSESVREIERRIGKVREGTERTVYAVQAGSAKVRGGAARFEQVGHSFLQIQERAQASTDRMRELLEVTRTQATGVRAVQDAMGQVIEAVERIAGATGEQLRASKGISSAAEEVLGLGQQVRSNSEEQRNGSAATVQAIESLEALIAETAASSQEQAAVVQSVMEALDVLRAVSQQSAQASSEMNEVVDLLTNRASRLERRLEGFSL